jgi:predicted RND superfamily exporter protein
MNRFFATIARRPRPVLAAMLAVSIVAIAGIARLRFDGSVQPLMVPGDPAERLYADVQKRFGDQEVGVIALLADDIYEPAVLEGLRSLTERITAIPGVARALSLSTASDPAADVIAPPPLLDRGPITPENARHLRERVLANPIYVPHLVARDGRAAAINVFFVYDRSEDDEIRIDHAIDDVIREYPGPGELHYTGMSHIRVRATEMMREDLGRFLPVSLLAMMIVLWLSFRSFRAVFLPLISIAIGTAILLGIMGWAGEPITLATLVLPSLLLVIGGSYAIHVTAAVLEHTEEQGEPIESTIRHVALPVLTSAFTNAVGFGSLAFHPIPAISGLGIYAVVGTLIVAFGTIVGLTVAFQAFPARARHRPRKVEEQGTQRTSPARDEAGTAATPDVSAHSEPHDLITRIAVAAADLAVRHRRVVFLVSVLVAVASLVGATRIDVSTDLLSTFRKSSDVRRDYDTIAERLAGPNPVSIVITGPETGYFRSIVSLRRLKDFQEFLESLDGIDSTLSIVDYLEELDLGLRSSSGELIVGDNGEVREAKPAQSFWDAPKEQLPQIFEIVSHTPQTFSGVVDPSFQRVRITARTAISGSRATRDLVHEIESYAAAMFPRGVQTQVTGNLVVISSVSNVVLSGQIQSIALAYGVIFFLLVFLFLSFRVGLAAMVPNILPNLVFFGVMGWGGVQLNLATSIISAVALGIGVDDTIHYMARLNQIVKNTHSHRDALLSTMRMIGRPVIATSITLTVGFLVMVVSRFALVSAFGWLSAITIFAAMTTNIVILPAVLATVPIVSVWDLVAARLGPSPNRTIPLFDGLGRLSTRLVVLLGKTRTYAPNAYVMRRGEPGSEMYLVLTGRAVVTGGPDGPVFAHLQRGDVVGEMGLLRHAVRSADVIAQSELDVLVIDEAFLRRLMIRYPRFASRFFLNIARILSDRLEGTNRRLNAAGITD